MMRQWPRPLQTQLPLCCTWVTCWLLTANLAHAESRYIGSQLCADCHTAQFATFTASALKNQSYAAVQKLAGELDREELMACYACHTTGYGKPGGFVSLEETPALANCGCEVCHGPGSVHAASGKATDIVRQPAKELCETCHTQARVQSFRFRPMRYAGAH